MAVERPAEGEEIQGLAALLLSRGADGAARLQHPPLRGALGHKHAAHQPPQGLEAGQIHQNLDTVAKRDVFSCRLTLTYSNETGKEAFYSVLSQKSGCFSLVRDGQPDVWEGGEIVAEAATHFHFDGLAGGH